MLQTIDTTPGTIVQRIDAIMGELQLLRQIVVTLHPIQPRPSGLVQQLYGALGHGDWDEYDPQLDWTLFES